MVGPRARCSNQIKGLPASIEQSGDVLQLEQPLNVGHITGESIMRSGWMRWAHTLAILLLLMTWSPVVVAQDDAASKKEVQKLRDKVQELEIRLKLLREDALPSPGIIWRKLVCSRV